MDDLAVFSFSRSSHQMDESAEEGRFINTQTNLGGEKEKK